MMYRRLNTVIRTLGSGIVLALVSSAAFAAEYELDPAHTHIYFQTNHLGFSLLPGRFNRFDGSFTWDKDNPETASVTFTVRTASIDTNWAERDKHLRGEDYLNVDKYPTATFKSTGYTGDADSGVMKGILTLRGVSKPISLQVQRIGEGDDPWGGYRVGFKATTTINRMEFGKPFWLPEADMVDLNLYLEGIRQ